MQIKNFYYIFFFYTILYVILFFTCLNINYVEGDDAATILYHLCGRNDLIQAPYAAYNSGFDYILSFFKIDEVFLRSFSISISFLFGYFVLLLSVFFIFLLSNEKGNLKIIYFNILLPFIIPDFIFHSLIINSTNISYTFSILSIIFYYLYLKNNKLGYFIIAILAMGISIPFRWSMLTFYPLFLSFLMFYNISNNEKIFKKFKSFIILSTFSLIIGILLIYISGYNLKEILNIFLWGNNYMKDAERSILSLFAISSSFFTLPFILLLIVGLFYFIVKQKTSKIYKFIFILCPIIPYIILGFLPAFKYLIALLPILIYISYLGFLEIFKKRIFKFLFIFLLLFIWLIGINIDADGIMYGSGFEYKDTPQRKINLEVNEKNVDNRIKINTIKLSLSGGFYLPSAEGPRPLWGFFHVIFGGLWNTNIDKFTSERDYVINKLLNDDKLIVFQDRPAAFLQCDLYKHGYQISDAIETDTVNKINYRTFYSKSDTLKFI